MTHPLPPEAQLLGLITGYMLSQGAYVAAKFGIADQLKSGPKSADELAKSCGAHAPSLYRMLRMLASVGVFSEGEDGKFSATQVGELLQSGKMRDMAIMMAAPFHWRVYEDMLYSITTGKPAFDKVHGTPAFQWLSKKPEEAQIFDNAMTSFTMSLLPVISGACNLSGVKKLVDVGGGHGILLCHLLKANPGLQGVVYDMPHVIEGTKKRIAAEGLSSRCEAVGGSFFESVPTADAYIMKHIIHDWDDEKAGVILKHCRKSMSKDGRVILVEAVVPPGNTPSFDKVLDLEMLMIPSGKERTEKEFRELFKSAGLKLEKIIPTPSPVQILEARAV